MEQDLRPIPFWTWSIPIYKRAILPDTIKDIDTVDYPFCGTKNMKKELHPMNYDVIAHCTCGNEFPTTSTRKELRSTLCSQCHPFFTGDQKFVDTAGRIEKFKKKYSKLS